LTSRRPNLLSAPLAADLHISGRSFPGDVGAHPRADWLRTGAIIDSAPCAHWPGALQLLQFPFVLIIYQGADFPRASAEEVPAAANGGAREKAQNSLSRAAAQLTCCAYYKIICTNYAAGRQACVDLHADAPPSFNVLRCAVIIMLIARRADSLEFEAIFQLDFLLSCARERETQLAKGKSIICVCARESV
jgi:hypothetical protein